MNRLTVLEMIPVNLYIAAFFIAPIAWIVFIVSCFRIKSANSDSARKRRRTVRTISLIAAILFTILLHLFIYALSKGEGGVPIPTNPS